MHMLSRLVKLLQWKVLKSNMYVILCCKVGKTIQRRASCLIKSTGRTLRAEYSAMNGFRSFKEGRILVAEDPMSCQESLFCSLRKSLFNCLKSFQKSGHHHKILLSDIT